MSNRDLAAIFQELADLEEIEGNRWESLAYKKVAASILTLSEDILEVKKKGTLRDLDGVGPATEKKILEYLDTGIIEKHRKMKEKYPIDFTTLRKIQGLGPKRMALLYSELRIQNIEDLEKALDSGAISNISGFGTKSEDSLKRSLDVYKRTGANRLFLAYVFDDINAFLDKLKNNDKFLTAEVAGSTRRRRETIGDLDILAVCQDSKECIDYFSSLDEIDEVVARGDTKVTVRLKYGINCDLRVMEADSYGAAMQYFTGSKDHNIRMRDLAISNGLKLNEYGLYKGEQRIAGNTEEGIYSSLGLDWIPPELRENLGEIEAASGNSLPELVEYRDVLGDFHSHTSESDGTSTLSEMIKSARESGLKYIGVTDHSVSLKVANGLDEKRFRKRIEEIDQLNSRDDSFRILKGVELEIKKDGSLDLPVSLLKEMDVVVIALHQWISDNADENTKRVITAVESGLGFSLAHPTGRTIGTRDPYPLNFDRIFEACKDNNVALEINGFPERSDLPYTLVKKAKDYGLKFALASDAHNTLQLNYLKFATSIARRGWLEKKDVLNCLPYDRLFKK